MKTYKAIEEAIEVINARATMIEHYLDSDHFRDFMRNIYGEKFKKAYNLRYKLWNKVHKLWSTAGSIHKAKINLISEIG